MNTVGKILTFCSALVLAAATGVGQVRQVDTGHALDASPLVGSGGRNTRGVTPSEVLRSDLFVTGQVTGLGGFRGPLPYTPGDQMHVNLPSASISPFLRRSVGLQDVLSGPTYRTRPFYSQAQTAFGLGGIRQGLTEPGSNVPLRSVAPSQKLIDKAALGYRPLLDQPGLLLDTRADALATTPAGKPGPLIGGAPDYAPTTGFESVDVGPGGAGYAPANLPDWMTASGAPLRPGAAALFATPRVRQRRQLAEQLRQLAHVEDRIGGPLDTRIDTEVMPTGPSVGRYEDEREDDELDIAPDVDRADDDNRPYGFRQRPLAPQTPPAEGEGVQDVYLEFLRELAGREEGEEPTEAEQPEEPGAELPTQPGAEPGETSPAELAGFIERQEDGRIIIHRLSGLSDDPFNANVKIAERYLKNGRYYDAVDQFEMCVMLRPNNPLGRMGLSLSLFAAGEPLSAAGQLRRAMLIMPAMMEARLNVLLLADEQTFEARLQRLDARVTDPDARSDESLLLLTFLDVFLNDSLEQTQKAQRMASLLLDRLKETEPAGEAAELSRTERRVRDLYEAYATFMLTGRRPAETTGQ